VQILSRMKQKNKYIKLLQRLNTLNSGCNKNDERDHSKADTWRAWIAFIIFL